jgi:hypothetical protein
MKRGARANKKTLEFDLAKVMHRTYGDYRQIMWRSFVSGLFTALGATVGLAVVLTIAVYILERLAILPIVGDFFSVAYKFFLTAAPKI